MHVPLVVVGAGVAPGPSDTPVSTRRVFHTVLDWAGLGAAHSLRGPEAEIVLGEAMRPFLSYGWQPQVMAVEGRQKVIRAGRTEVYDVVADPAETRDLSATAQVSRPLRDALREYPVPSLAPPPRAEALGEEERRQLASLGYVSAGAQPVVRQDAPRPADMVSPLRRPRRGVGPLRARGVRPGHSAPREGPAEDPDNLDAALRLATAHSALGHERQALALFERASDIAPGSQDVRTYLALHYARGRQWERAVPLLERVVAESPDRLPALEALARLRERQGRGAEALDLRQKVYAVRTPSPAELVRLGQLAMGAERTQLAIEWFEKARGQQGKAFAHDLELGVLYLAARRFPEAREALDRVPASHSGYAMALFKRAQVSVLLREPDQAARIEAARRGADATTRELIGRERLFQAPASRPGVDGPESQFKT